MNLKKETIFLIETLNFTEYILIQKQKNILDYIRNTQKETLARYVYLTFKNDPYQQP